MSIRRSDSVIIRLERAGGNLSEASRLVSQAGDGAAELDKAIRAVNILVGDLRRVVVKVQQGEQINIATALAILDWPEVIEGIK